MEGFCEFVDIKRIGKMTFDFLHCWADVLEVQRVFRMGKTGVQLRQARQKCKALHGECRIVHFAVLQIRF